MTFDGKCVTFNLPLDHNETIDYDIRTNIFTIQMQFGNDAYEQNILSFQHNKSNIFPNNIFKKIIFL